MIETKINSISTIKHPAISNQFRFRVNDATDAELLVNQCLSYRIFIVKGDILPEQYIEATYEVDRAFDVIRQIHSISKNPNAHHIEIYSMSGHDESYKGRFDFMATLEHVETEQSYSSNSEVMKIVVKWKVATIL